MTHANQVNDAISNQLQKNEALQNERKCHNLTMIGLPSSGKTAIYHQLMYITKQDLNKPDLPADSMKPQNVREYVYTNVVDLCLFIQDSHHYQQLIKLSIDNEDHFKQIASIIKSAWNEKAQNIYKQRYVYKYGDKIQQNLAYFIKNIDTIMSIDYVPTYRDTVLYYTKFKQFKSFTYDIKENIFKITDVPSTFNSQIRKKGYILSDNPSLNSAIIYTVNLSEYCQYTSDGKSKLEQDVAMFRTICDCKWFRKGEMVLFLNQDDIFREQLRIGLPFAKFADEDKARERMTWNDKYYNQCVANIGAEYDYGLMKVRAVNGFIRSIHSLDSVPLDIIEIIRGFVSVGTKYQFDMDGAAGKQIFDEHYEAAIKYIQDLFISQNQIQNRVIFCHVCSATDADTVQKIIWDCQNILVRSNLRRGS